MHSAESKLAEQKLATEAQLNKQLTELETMPQKEVDRIIIHDLHGQPIKRHEGKVYKDPRDDPALGNIGRDVLHPGGLVSNIQPMQSMQPMGTAVIPPPTEARSQPLVHEPPLEEHMEGEKKKGFFARMKNKYQDWKERRRQKKLARERGEPTSPLSPSPGRGLSNEQVITTQTSQIGSTGHLDPSKKDVKSTGHWDYPDQRMAQAQMTLLDPKRELTGLTTGMTGVTGMPMTGMSTTQITTTQIPQTELRSGIVHPGLSQDFTNRPQAEFLVAQTTVTQENFAQQPVFQQQQQQPAMVIDDLTRPAKNLVEGVSGSYGLAANPFQPINDLGLEKIDKRLVRHPEAGEPRGVGVDNLLLQGQGLNMSPVGSNLGFSSNLQPPHIVGSNVPLSTSLNQPFTSSIGIQNYSNIRTFEPVNIQSTNIQETNIQQQAEMRQAALQAAETFNVSGNIPGLTSGVNPQFAQLQNELLQQGALKPTETIISVEPMKNVTENLDQLTLNAQRFLQKQEGEFVQPGMIGDLSTGLSGGRQAAKESEKARPSPLGSSH